MTFAFMFNLVSQEDVPYSGNMNQNTIAQSKIIRNFSEFSLTKKATVVTKYKVTVNANNIILKCQ